MTTRGDARAAAAERLRSSGDATAALDADLLLAHACGVSKEELYAHLDAPLAAAEDTCYASLVARRAAGEPVGYLRGHKEFFGLRFAVDPRVLIPRPETEVLVEAALAFMRRASRFRAVDVGTGSGAIAVAIAVSEPRARVVATDVSAGALEVAAANVAAHGVGDRVELRHGDLLEPIDAPVDVIAANLPYLSENAFPSVRRPRREATRSSVATRPGAPTPEAGGRALPERRTEWVGERTSLFFEPREAVVAGEDGLDLIRRCLAQAPSRIAPGGALFLECDPPQVDAIRALVAAATLDDVRVLRDLTGAPRVVHAVRA